MNSVEKRGGWLSELCDHALGLGANAAVVVPASTLVVENRFVDLCKEGCPSYGLSPGCPPHAMTPAEFRTMLKGYSDAVLFRVNASMDDLQGEGRLSVASLVHDISAALERKARMLGFVRVYALAAGSCKELFCKEGSCVVLAAGEACRFPDRARPSVSAHGVDVGKLCSAVGWKLSWEGEGGAESAVMGMMMGVALAG